jgi:hypothetical protein
MANENGSYKKGILLFLVQSIASTPKFTLLTSKKVVFRCGSKSVAYAMLRIC